MIEVGGGAATYDIEIFVNGQSIKIDSSVVLAMDHVPVLMIT